MRADDRPIYALRARGFEPGQSRFADINEAVTTYVAAVRQKQPQGPYALAGYSYGTMLAFEMAKRLGADDGPGEELSWNVCLLHLTQFLGLGTAAFADEQTAAPSDSPYHRATRREALAWILQAVDASRLRDLGLGARQLTRWADVAYGLQSMAIDYEPSGLVPSIDVFHAEPLKVAAPPREVWVTEHLSRWSDFSRSEPRFHGVGGAHYTMIGPEYVASFSEKLQAALNARGI
ncbi:hypothetical protein DL765_007459 [Monosporascus sp. GIB2]|nr:hypothetical protein DL765_007459 [Monosporascus sp. GIB2]